MPRWASGRYRLKMDWTDCRGVRYIPAFARSLPCLLRYVLIKYRQIMAYLACNWLPAKIKNLEHQYVWLRHTESHCKDGVAAAIYRNEQKYRYTAF